MQEHRQEHHQEPLWERRAHGAPALPTSGLNLPDSASHADARLNVYLDAVCALMSAQVPIQAIADMRREMRDHLQAALVAFGELGYEPGDALTLTLTQFGEPHVVAEHWRQASAQTEGVRLQIQADVAALPEAASNRIEDYLDHVCAPLVDSVPYEARRALRREMKQHLDATIAAHSELGSTPEQAVTQALTQFGDARQIARHWLNESQYASLAAKPLSRVTATLIALGMLSFTTFSAGGLAMLPGPGFAGLIGAIFLLSALTGGLATGVLLRAHAVRATVSATIVISVGALVIFTALWGWKNAIAFGLVPLLCGLAFACPGAYIGSRRLRTRFRNWITA